MESPTVQFHILKTESVADKHRYIADLIAQLWQQHQQIQLWLPDLNTANEWDEYLWTYTPERFLPHQVFDPALPKPAPIVLVTGELSPTHITLINLHHTLPTPMPETLTTVIEVVSQEPTDLVASRERYRGYQQLGCPLTTLKV